MEEFKTIDERADEYVKSVNLDPNTYKGDVHTAYVMGCLDQERITSKVLKELDSRLMEVENRTAKDVIVGAVRTPVFGGISST